MLKKHGQLFLSALIASDILVIALSWLGAYYIRFHLRWIPLERGLPEPEIYLWALIPILLVVLATAKAVGLYQPLRGKPYFSELVKILKVTSFSVLILASITFFYREESFSRAVAVYFWGLLTLLMGVSHWVVRRFLMELRRRGYNLRHILVLGAGELGQTVAEKIRLHPEYGYKIVGYLTSHPAKVGQQFKGIPVIGLYSEVTRLIKDKGVDQLYIALPLKSGDRLETILGYLGEETVSIRVVPDLLQFMNIQAGVEELDGLPIVNLSDTPLYGWNIVIKRTTDILLSTLAIIITSPIMILVAVLVKLESPGPVFYRQEREGLDRRVFPMLKFRSMRTDAEKDSGPVWARENDDRRTRLGKFIRGTSLDELPQLFNVLMGDMSLVGPRPERPVFVEEFKKSIPHYVLRLKMKAGLTGWAQVNGWRGNTSLEKRIEFDLYYIKHWSLWFDLKILLMTIWKGFVNRHAY
ncbi:MAG: undecaprenyl-phosphate glucose phosphotransferase [Nitrospinae bacterium CG11_big_fil_rev_8_21_14_0_20_56_8]|nr:MAG: undecaprenyl-phosphate glucose phosphotransferase [Nitrospinae bacterium CG11_big_fil_rev_8_21_14_0_20_56_8]